MNYKILHDAIAEGLCIEKSLVIWANQNGTRPNKDHATIQLMTAVEETPAEERRNADDHSVHTRYLVSFDVNYYSIEHMKATDKIMQLLDYLCLPTTYSKLDSGGMVYVDYDNVQDLTALIDGVRWESRANVTLKIRTVNVNDIDELAIESVIVERNGNDGTEQIPINKTDKL